MKNYKINEYLTLKIAHLIGQYYTFLKELKVFTDAQILYITSLIILLPYCSDEESMFNEIKEWFKLSLNGQISYKDEPFKFINDEDEIKIKNKSFLFSFTNQIIVSLFEKTNMATYFQIFNQLNEPWTKKDVYYALMDGLEDTESIYFSLSRDELKANLINFFAIEKYAKEIYNFKLKINLGYNHKFTTYVIYQSKSDNLEKEQLKEKSQSCALCGVSIHNLDLTKYKYLNSVNEGKIPLKQTDLFATGDEVNFKNNHFICLECTIEKFARVQLLIDDGILTEEYLKELVKEGKGYKVYNFIFKNSILKYMPASLKERRKLVLSDSVEIFKDVYF